VEIGPSDAGVFQRDRLNAGFKWRMFLVAENLKADRLAGLRTAE
jgi:hypothetical protein